jgi:hypothetical protein
LLPQVVLSSEGVADFLLVSNTSGFAVKFFPEF